MSSRLLDAKRAEELATLRRVRDRIDRECAEPLDVTSRTACATAPSATRLGTWCASSSPDPVTNVLSVEERR